MFVSLSCFSPCVPFLELMITTLPSSTSRAGAGYGVRTGADRSPRGIEGAADPCAHLATIWQLAPHEALYGRPADPSGGAGALPRHHASLGTHETQDKSKTTISLSGLQPCRVSIRVLLQKHLAISYIIRGTPFSKFSHKDALEFSYRSKQKKYRPNWMCLPHHSHPCCLR